MKLADLIQKLDYCFFKVIENIAPAGCRDILFGKNNLDIIIQKYTEFKVEFEKRESLPSTESKTDKARPTQKGLPYYFNVMMHALQRLKEYYEKPSSSIPNEQDAMIFAEYAIILHAKMVQFASELDEIYQEPGEQAFSPYPERQADTSSGVGDVSGG